MKIILYALFVIYSFSGCIKFDNTLPPELPAPCTSDSTGCTIMLRDFDTQEPIKNARVKFDSLEYLCIYWCNHTFLETQTDSNGVCTVSFPNTTKWVRTNAVVYLDTSLYLPYYWLDLPLGCQITYDIQPKVFTFVDITITNKTQAALTLKNIYVLLPAKNGIPQLQIDSKYLNETLEAGQSRIVRLKSNPNESIGLRISYNSGQRKELTVGTNSDPIFAVTMNITE